MATRTLPRNARHAKPRSAALAREAPSAGTPGKIILSHRYKGPGEEQNTTGGVAGRGAPQDRDRVVDGARRPLEAAGAEQAAIVGRLAVFRPAARVMSGGVHVRSFRDVSIGTRTPSQQHLPSHALGDQYPCVPHNSCVAQPPLPAVPSPRTRTVGRQCRRSPPLAATSSASLQRTPKSRGARVLSVVLLSQPRGALQ